MSKLAHSDQASMDELDRRRMVENGDHDLISLSALSNPQEAALRRLVELKMPASFVRDGWPGFPEACVDLRSMRPLERFGLAESGIHEIKTVTGRRLEIYWRATEAGRRAVAQAAA